ncbi:hypothetical protein COCMIDRAFT_84247 [Bipolaris oryzae ATCC 44560]|uniref:Velvet domain-containing protein n=1 Tax=Bipolaris oryzae ATCC 44560 TaxID=930090 RepID=W6ZCT1_COCMI|nr:uncharacterized protein COCMIDRAFT_84247 [Bipolaris oryzae ATCC 44560]EUC49627.1 hypothetical protein COCMIDRAFT_84247 [Bipolaris oryzae ATCC 44560]
MPRASRRGRGRHHNSSRAIASRRVTSNSPSTSQSRTSLGHTTAHNTDSHPPLRRSARIAELLNGQSDRQLADTASSMADVARPRALGGRSHRPVHHPGSARTSGNSRSSRLSLSPDEIRYAMDIVVQPPRTAQVGQTIPGSIIVRLRTTNADADDAIADSTNLVAVAALVPASSSSDSPDPSALNTLLTGRIFDTVHPFSDDEADGFIASMDMADPNGVGYMRFPELIIRQAGTYRIRITLIRIRNSASDPPVTSAGNGLAVHVVDSNPIVVSGGGSATSTVSRNGGDDIDDGGWLEVLRSIQDRRRSR